MNLYLTLKALHIIAAIFWMAALLYLPRLFVYHAETLAQNNNTDQHETFATMERKLLRQIATPAMLATLILGLALLATATPAGAWFPLKLLALLPLFALHGLCARWRRTLATGTAPHTPRFFRLANEIPAVLIAVIVILAVTKPL
ncbi:MAG: protoporphyrinogen oxidase HemJ [Alphaproteobacteria bacterium]|nr:protoporphyrinogen oxidase HemJ [Alphaproteobacteria bacterium]MDA8004738.1 protoporphyrinogen oxidase HemJ [Alphaproteobacteria bacterium]MDA8006003.1 protoporphyrinogen oxidase HemJ [Alphaproteobacteria bacterium]MDA8013376.1 protoporphyrinogen oxidase HemJ [Alphaproteobacteria bacterium]